MHSNHIAIVSCSLKQLKVVCGVFHSSKRMEFLSMDKIDYFFLCVSCEWSSFDYKQILLFSCVIPSMGVLVTVKEILKRPSV